MGRSLMDVARSIVESNDSAPDRDAKKKTANSSTLRPGSKFKEADPKKNSAKFVTDAPVSLDDYNDFHLDGGVKKDTSASSRSPNDPEPMHKLSEDVEDLIVSMMEEGMSDEEIAEAITEYLEEERLDEISKQKLGNYVRNAAVDMRNHDEDDFKAEYRRMGLNSAVNRLVHGNKAGIDKSSRENADIRDALRHYQGLDEETLDEIFAEGLEEGYSEDEIAEAIADYLEEGQDDDSEFLDAARSVTEQIMSEGEMSVSEDVHALLEGEDLSEEFKEKAETIFQAAVAARLQEGVDILERRYAEALQEHTEEIYAQLHEEIDEVLNYVVEQWMIDNEVAIESGLRNELSEEFIAGLRQLFMEHYVDIPESEVPLVDAMSAQIAELEEAVNEEISKNAFLSGKLNEMAKHEITNAITEGLTTTQAEKLHTLAEGIEFNDPESYAERVLTLRESYFPQNKRETSVGLDNNSESFADGSGILNEDNSRIGHYAKALAKR